MQKIKFEELPKKVGELIENQEKIMSMLSESQKNSKEQYIDRHQLKEMLNISSDVTVIEMEKKKD